MTPPSPSSAVCRYRRPKSTRVCGESKGQEVNEGHSSSRGPWVGGGEEAQRRPQTLLTHLQQEGNSQHVAQCARQPLQVPQQHLMASLGPEV